MNVLGLRFRDAHLGLQARGVGHAGQIGAGLHLGADLDGQHLQHARHAGADRKGIGLIAAEFRLGPDAINLRFLDGELRRDRFVGESIAFLLDGVLRARVLRRDLRAAQFQGGDETVLEQLVVDLGLEPGGFEFGLGAGQRGLGVEHAFLERHLVIREFGLGRLELRIRAGGSLRHAGIAEHQDHAVRRDDGTRPQHDAIDTAIGARGDPADFLRHERAQTAHLPDHRAALHGIDPHEVALDRGRGGLEAREGEGHADQGDSDDAGDNDAFLALFLGCVGSGNIHEVVVCT